MKNSPATDLNNKFNKSFCIKPFTEISNSATGHRMLCCQSQIVIPGPTGNDLSDDFFNHSVMHDIRKKMLAGEEIPQCNECTSKEKMNGTSHRTFIMSKAVKEIPDVVQDIWDNGTVQVLSLDIRFGNKCNLACVMCSAGSSSLIAKELGRDTADLNDFSLEQIKLNAKNIRQFKTTGGEPMLLPGYKKTLEYLVESGYSKNIEFTTITNGTVDFTDLLPLMNEFKRFKLSISLDAADDVYHYVRWPGTFSRVQRIHKRVVDQLHKYENITLQFAATVHVLNVNQPVKIAKYLATLGDRVDYIVDYVKHPSYMQPGLAHIDTINELHQEVIEWIEECRDTEIDSFSEELLDFIDMVSYNYTQVNKDQQRKQLSLDKLEQKTEFWELKRKLKVRDWIPGYNKIQSQ